ncbi:hypothetical protein LDENG_00220150 [Lucifuga dentata]|nr:hypothetical protein LDENG_00220150 [Lucifuga dentata]
MDSSVLGGGLGLVLVEFQYEYESRDGSLVSIKPNERYMLLAKTNDHWWQVRRDHSTKSFYIPAKYVKELPPDFPSPLDFADPSSPEPVLLSAAAQVPFPVPLPKALERTQESSGAKTIPGDEVTIRLRPDASYRKTENRMSTFGMPLELHDPSPLAQQRPSAPAETRTSVMGGTNSADSGLSRKQTDLSGFQGKPVSLDDQKDSRKVRVPSFSPADPLAKLRSQTQPIPVETPVIPVISPANNPHNSTSPSVGYHDNSESLIEPDEEEEVAEESSVEENGKEEEELQHEEDSNHIYESIQDLNLDIAGVVAGRGSPSVAPKPSPAQDHSSLVCDSSIYANIFSSKKPSSSQISIPTPSLPCPSDPDSSLSPSGHTCYSSPECINSTSPGSPQEGWQGSRWEQLVDEASGRIYFYNPQSGATSWAAPEPLCPADSATKRQDNGPPPLPEEDYPTDDTHDAVFTQNSQQKVGLIPRAHLDLSPPDPDLDSNPPGPSGSINTEGKMVSARPHQQTFVLSHRRNLSDLGGMSSTVQSPDSPQGHVLEKAGILNKTKVVDNGKRLRKNWAQSWTVLHGGILTFHKDPRSAPAGNANKASHIVPEYTVELRGSSVNWAPKDKSSKKNVLELKTRQGCEYLMQYDTESIISDWHKVILGTIRQLEQEHLSEEEEDEASDKEDKDRRRTSRSSSSADSEQRRVRKKLKRFLQRRPTLQSVKEKGYIRDNVFGCHLDTLCHRENTTVPKFVEKCIRVVERRGLDVDGIYRVSGNLAVIQKLRHKADHEEQLELEDGQWEEIHVITGALKLFFRELPEPLFPFSCFSKFIAAIQVPDYSQRVSFMKDLVQSLPLPNHDTMELLFRHLRKVIDHGDSNRMSLQCVAIVFGPTLLRPQTESANMTVHMVFQSQIVELMLKEFQRTKSDSSWLHRSTRPLRKPEWNNLELSTVLRPAKQTAYLQYHV